VHLLTGFDVLSQFQIEADVQVLHLLQKASFLH
jgi:hypothetical protein